MEANIKLINYTDEEEILRELIKKIVGVLVIIAGVYTANAGSTNQ